MIKKNPKLIKKRKFNYKIKEHSRNSVLACL